MDKKLLIAGGVFVCLVIGIIIYFVFFNDDEEQSTTTVPPRITTTTAPAASGTTTTTAPAASGTTTTTAPILDCEEGQIESNGECISIEENSIEFLNRIRTQIWDASDQDQGDEKYLNRRRKEDRLRIGGPKTWYPQNVENDPPHYMTLCQSATSDGDCWELRDDGKIGTNVDLPTSNQPPGKSKFAFVRDNTSRYYSIKNKETGDFLCNYGGHIETCRPGETSTTKFNFRQW